MTALRKPSPSNGIPRFGSDVDALVHHNEGLCWLATGFPVDADADMVANVITRFCRKNPAELQEIAAAWMISGIRRIQSSA